MRKKVSAMLEIVVCDDDIADLERAVNMLHKIFTSQKIAYADFMTAMMAFFLVMWLISISSPKELIMLKLSEKT